MGQLAHVLKLIPRPLINDVMRFIVKSGLTGKRFLGLRDQDLVELGINVSCRCVSSIHYDASHFASFLGCRIFSAARERLRQECLRGRIFGFEGSSSGRDSSEEEQFGSRLGLNDTSLHPEMSGVVDKGGEDWTNSWRHAEGKQSRGRVKGLAQVFEREGASSLHRAEQNPLSGELEEVGRIRRSMSRRSISRCSSYDSLASIGYDEGRVHFGDIDAGEGIMTPKDYAIKSPFTWNQDKVITLDFPDTNSNEESNTSSSEETVFTTQFGAAKILVLEESRDDVNSLAYQSRILSHGPAAYSTVRKSTVLQESIEKIDGMPANELVNIAGNSKMPVPSLAMSLPASSSLLSIHASGFEDDVRGEEAGDPDNNQFASTDELCDTLKKRSIHFRTGSVEDFGSIRLSSIKVKSTKASKGSARSLGLLVNLPTEEESDTYLSLKNGDGSVVVIERRQLEEV